MVFIGKVISLEDEYDAGRIKVRLKNADVSFSDDNLPYAWPLLPKMLHVVPKVNEAVLVFCVNDDPKQQRFYLGPIISQYQKMYKDYHDTSALKMIGGRGGSHRFHRCHDRLPHVALWGRPGTVLDLRHVRGSGQHRRLHPLCRPGKSEDRRDGIGLWPADKGRHEHAHVQGARQGGLYRGGGRREV